MYIYSNNAFLLENPHMPNYQNHYTNKTIYTIHTIVRHSDFSGTEIRPSHCMKSPFSLKYNAPPCSRLEPKPKKDL